MEELGIVEDVEKIAICALYLGPPEEELVIQLPMGTTWETAKHALKKKLSAEKQFTTLRKVGDRVSPIIPGRPLHSRVWLNGEQVEGLVDTGASVSCIGWELYQQTQNLW